MQTVKKFVFGRDYTGNYNGDLIEDQINEYLEYHPGYSIITMSVSNSVACKEAFVVFNVREERPEKDIKRSNKQDTNSISTKDYKNQGNSTTTAHNNSKT